MTLVLSISNIIRSSSSVCGRNLGVLVLFAGFLHFAPSAFNSAIAEIL
jgi:hypothetical protein